MLGFCYFSKSYFFSHAMAKMIWRSNMEKSTIEKALQAFYFNCWLPLLLWLGGCKFTYCLWFIRDCVLFTVKKNLPLSKAFGYYQIRYRHSGRYYLHICSACSKESVSIVKGVYLYVAILNSPKFQSTLHRDWVIYKKI